MCRDRRRAGYWKMSLGVYRCMETTLIHACGRAPAREMMPSRCASTECLRHDLFIFVNGLAGESCSTSFRNMTKLTFRKSRAAFEQPLYKSLETSWRICFHNIFYEVAHLVFRIVIVFANLNKKQSIEHNMCELLSFSPWS
eukprot:UN25770